MRRIASQLRLSLFLLGVTTTLSGGCVCREVSTDRQYLGQMHVGQTFVLTRDVFVIDTNDGRLFFDPVFCTPGLWVDVPGRGSILWGSPLPTVEEWDRTHNPHEIRGVIRAGAVVSLDKIIYDAHIEDDDSYYVFDVVDGAFRGRPVCFNLLMEPRSPEPKSRLYRVPNSDNMHSTR